MNDKSIEDIYSREYYLTNEISRGGQGVVYRTNDPDIAIKMELDGERIKCDPTENKKYIQLCHLPIPEDLHITRPLTTLKSVTGYTMNLLSDMISFDKAFSQMPAVLPNNEWIDSTFNDESLKQMGQLYRKYYASGGSRRRLQAYLKAAFVFSQLHENGLIYGDLNAENLFVSSIADSSYPAVWLIDADNVNYISNNSTGYYTQRYCAPEASRGVFSFASDCYSFAVLLFEHITMQHPFEGSQYSEWDDFDGPVEDEIAKGSFAWIWDEDDDSNKLEPYLPPSYYLNDDLISLFAQTFSDEARQKPGKRPTIMEWSNTIARLLDNTVVCTKCGMGFNALSHSDCPWCDAVIPMLTISCYQFSGATKKEIRKFHHEINDGDLIHIPMRAVGGFIQNDTDAFQIIIRNDKITYSGFNNSIKCVYSQNDTIQPVFGKIELPIGTHIFIIKDTSDGYETEIEVHINNGL